MSGNLGKYFHRKFKKMFKLTSKYSFRTDDNPQKYWKIKKNS